MRTIRLATTVALAMLATSQAQGHVLDQLVVASRLQVEASRVVVELDLTPGAELAQLVFFAINSDRDGLISPAEGRSYARQVLKDLSLVLDGRPLALELSEATYPTFADMRAGAGTIHLRAHALTGTSVGQHRLHFYNRHREDVGVYLVNALVPDTPQIALGAPRRDQRQQSFDLEYEQRSSSDAGQMVEGHWWLAAIGLSLASTSFIARRWRLRRPSASYN